MLTGYQCEVIAFATDGDIVCVDCAKKAYGELAIEKAEQGLETAYPDLSPFIRYTLDEYVSESAWEYASQEHEEGTEAFDELYNRLCEAGHPCGDCGEGIS